MHYFGEGFKHAGESIMDPKKSIVEEDIAIITLQKPVKFDPKTLPVCIGSTNIEANFTRIIVSGWGTSSFYKEGGHLVQIAPGCLWHVEIFLE